MKRKVKRSAMRGKEDAHDYRYFPDPDLVSLSHRRRLESTCSKLRSLNCQMHVKRDIAANYGLPSYDAAVITASMKMADFFEESLQYTQDAKAVSNWIMGDLLGYLNANNLEFTDVKITGKGLGEMIGLIEKGTISNKIAKTVFKEMIETGKEPQKIVEEQGLVQISDEGAIKAVVEQVVENSPQSVADFKAGKEKAVGFLVGQVMKETKGKANPGLVNKLIVECLNSK